MKYLNLGCGGVRLQGEEWWNLDCLRSVLAEGTPERKQLDSEQRYVDHQLPNPLPFDPETFDGIICSHVIEHFDCHDAVRLIHDCRRVLVKGGAFVASVPNAEYFLSVYEIDTKERAEELFGEPIHDDWQPNFMSYALFHREHKQVLTPASLNCLLLQGGFDLWNINDYPQTPAAQVVWALLNRRRFSAVLCALKASE